MSHPIGEQINELYQWMHYNGFVMNNRQKHELGTILKAAVNRRTALLQQELQNAKAKRATTE